VIQRQTLNCELAESNLPSNLFRPAAPISLPGTERHIFDQNLGRSLVGMLQKNFAKRSAGRRPR
jgi:hypothetical protein